MQRSQPGNKLHSAIQLQIKQDLNIIVGLKSASVGYLKHDGQTTSDI